MAKYILDIATDDVDALYIRVNKEGPSNGVYIGLPFDTGVYTRNMLFRTAFSSKAGSHHILYPTYRLHKPQV